MKNNVKLVDIARELDVSVGLVSLVLRDKWKKNRISEAMAKKVMETSRKMGYKPNAMAQALRTGQSKIIGLIVADISNPFYGRVAKIIENEANKLGYQVIFGSSDENLERFESAIQAMNSRQVDGMIIVPVAGADNLLQELSETDSAFVCIDRYLDGEHSAVVTDNRKASSDVAEYILRKGHKHITLISQQNDISSFYERVEGFSDAVDLLPSAHCDVHTLPQNELKESLEKLLYQLRDGETEVLYFVQNLLAIEGLKLINSDPTLLAKKWRIVGFDNPVAFEINNPQITCYEQPVDEIGRIAVKQLIDQITGANGNAKATTRLEGRLIQRSSC